MNKSRNLMTKRTFGLLTTLSVLSVGAFTAALVLGYPNSGASNSNEYSPSDTQSIDRQRTVANSDSTRQAAASNRQSALSNGTTSQPEQSSADTTTKQLATDSNRQSTSSTQMLQPTDQPTAASDNPPNEQPVVVTWVHDTIDKVANFLPL